MANLKLIHKYLDAEMDPGFAARAKFIIDSIISRQPKKILDAGCGRGFYLSLISKLDNNISLVGIDTNNEYVNIAKKNLECNKNIKIIRSSIYKIAYPDNSFDFIICSEVLEHLTDDKKALGELRRLLKPGGYLIITVPNYHFPLLWDPINWVLMRFFNTHINKDIWWLAGIWADHHRLYTQQKLLKIITGKFKVIKSKLLIRWSWPFSHFLLYGIGKNIVEKGFLSDFNRFKITQKPPIIKFIAKFIALPSILLDPVLPTKSSVNICLELKK